MTDIKPFTNDEATALARKAVCKIDLQGQRGLTDVTLEEIAAMAVVLVISGALQTEPAETADTARADQGGQTGDDQ